MVKNNHLHDRSLKMVDRRHVFSYFIFTKPKEDLLNAVIGLIELQSSGT